MLSKGFVALLAFLASGPLSYAASLSYPAIRDTGDEAVPLDGIKFIEPDGTRAWINGNQVTVRWNSTIPSNHYWLILTIENDDGKMVYGPVLSGSTTGSTGVSFVVDQIPGEYTARLRPQDGPTKDLDWVSPRFIIINPLN